MTFRFLPKGKADYNTAVLDVTEPELKWLLANWDKGKGGRGLCTNPVGDTVYDLHVVKENPE